LTVFHETGELVLLTARIECECHHVRSRMEEEHPPKYISSPVERKILAPTDSELTGGVPFDRPSPLK
jgi:hypothetical protein